MLCASPRLSATEDDGASDSPSRQAGARSSQAAVSSLDTADLVEFTAQPTAVQSLIAHALALTRLNLSYAYGSSDPKNGGMDCSGTVYYLLRQAGVPEVPRDSSEMYKWAWQESRFWAVVSSHGDTFELAHLKPGDLLFWTGTYHIDRDPPVTHVMIFLGTDRQTGKLVMAGASDGRTFNGQPRNGVSVFDFKIPPAGGESRFIGYAAVPGLEKAAIAPAP
jgi:cell wall-associated NlpC family hydrolase